LLYIYSISNDIWHLSGDLPGSSKSKSVLS
jgi:hypothetical protein